ncbi:MAG: hypothetical protein GY862_19730, partial [Gammaproteobacteria bacterium]|nr:hypothetical protein [Gammaproteobacteria bacterium]
MGSVNSGAVSVRFFIYSFILLFALLPGVAVKPVCAASADVGTHFIILIDDSGDFKWHVKSGRIMTLPDILFHSVQTKQGVGTALPTYDPERDHLSLVFFTLTKTQRASRSPGECKPNIGLSALPEKFFHWETLPPNLSYSSFKTFLRSKMKKPCRFSGSLSPLVTAESIILPFVQKHLPKDLLFSRTVLLILSNDTYNTKSNPARELEGELYEAVKDKDEAVRLANRVSMFFRFDAPSDDSVFTVDTRNSKKFLKGGRQENIKLGNPLVYRVVNIHPNVPDVSSYIDYPREINLDRLAISNDELRIEPTRGRESAVVRILPADQLRPYRIRLEPLDREGGVWTFAGKQLPRQILLHIDNECFSARKCVEKEDGIHIDLFRLAGAELSTDANTSWQEQKAGHFHFMLTFLYDTKGKDTKGKDTKGVYDRHIIETGRKQIDVNMIKSLEIPADTYFPASLLDNETLVGQWTEEDGEQGLSQEVARERIVADRDAKRLSGEILAGLTGFAVLVLLMLVLYKRYHRRLFQPLLQWSPAKKIEIDFNQQAGARILAGTLQIENEGKIPFIGRLISIFTGKPEQPHRNARLSLEYGDLEKKYGFVLNSEQLPALGFVEPEEQAGLVHDIEELISNESAAFIFLATEAINDFRHKPTKQGHSVAMKAMVSMNWREKKKDTGKKEAQKIPIEFEIQLVAERAVPPRVRYTPIKNNDKCYFKWKKAIPVGELCFDSLAKRHFALPFEDKFNVFSYREGLPIQPESIKIEKGTKLFMQPGKPEFRKVYIDCDGTIVPNPEPPSQEYQFRLLGEFAPGSHLDQQSFPLYRDPTRADIKLSVTQFNTMYQVYWDKGNTPRMHPVSNNTQPPRSATLKHGRLELEPYDADDLRFDEDAPPPSLFYIDIGNTGKSGKGFVKVNLSASLDLKEDAKQTLKFKSGYDLGDFVKLLDDTNAEIDTFTVKEGGEDETCVIKLDTGIIEDVVGGRLEKEYAAIIVELDIWITDDKGDRTPHSFSIHAPVGLEKLPQRNWLCVDFGTSAIVAAEGAGNSIVLLPLQKVVRGNNPHRNIVDFDPFNLEKDSNYLLPSYVACDADLRDGNPVNDEIRKGFPSYKPASLKPGDPDFISLPASTETIRDHFNRVIFSLKSWLSQPSGKIALQEIITYYHPKDDKIVTRFELPLDETVQSGFAALAEAYIPQPARDPLHPRQQMNAASRFGQAIICHPNTFSHWHKQRLHTIASDALSARLGIVLPEERIHLLSESDAVAYNYCRQRATSGNLPPEAEHILVYDFGAGTVDLSLVYVHWNREAIYPKYWQVKNALGVPVAGNHLDSLLARLIHDLLNNEEVLDPKVFDYRYPVVDDELASGKEGAHRLAIHALWMAIRHTKQQDT